MTRLLVVAAASLLLSGCYGWGLWRSDRLIHKQGPVPRCAAIIVPGCPARPDGTPSTCIERRVGAAVAAWREGAAPLVIFSGGAVHNAASESMTMAAHARALGLPEAAIAVEPAARHTTDNLTNAARIVAARSTSDRRVLVVTDAFQLPYAVLMAGRAGLEPYGRLAHPPAPRGQIRRILALDRYEPVRALSWW